MTAGVQAAGSGQVFLHRPRHGHPLRAGDPGQAASHRGHGEASEQVGLPRLSGDREWQQGEEAETLLGMVRASEVMLGAVQAKSDLAMRRRQEDIPVTPILMLNNNLPEQRLYRRYREVRSCLGLQLRG